jgi:ribosomal protein S18 acetylase RimI-like enzyme
MRELPVLLLVPMSKHDFEHYEKAITIEYAKDLAIAEGLTREQSLARSQASTDSLLPDGYSTKNMWIFSPQNKEGETVGVLWLALNDQEESEMYVYDIEIFEQFRSRGFGRALMVAAEEFTCEIGMERIGLNVFGHNPKAKALYESLNYEVRSTSPGKIAMVKKL